MREGFSDTGTQTQTMNTKPDTSRQDTLGDRMKFYEGMEAERRFLPMLPVIARVDGRSFHNFTRGMTRPYDATFTRMMVDTTIALVRETNAAMGYTQSDEITLAWHSEDTRSQIWFDGRVAKMTSQIAAQATLCFYRQVLLRMPEMADRLPTFDGRVWQVPNRAEGANAFLWREWDATKNSISMAAQAHFSPRELHGKHGGQMKDMLMDKGINWNDYPAFFKRGTYVQRREAMIPFSVDELEKLPPKHDARSNPGLLVLRSKWEEIEMPPLATVRNKEGVIFAGETPLPNT